MPATTHKDRILRGEDLFTEGDFEGALAAFEEVLEKAPQNADALNDAGLAASELGLFVEAAEYYERALEARPHHASAFFNLIDLLVDEGELDLAQEAFHTYEGAIPSSEERKRYSEALFGFDNYPSASKTALRVAVGSFSDYEQDSTRRKRWGDHWFKKNLQEALVRAGVQVVPADQEPAVFIHLFGAPYQALPDTAYKILWIHSHPDWISPPVLKQYDKIYCLSPTFARRIESWGFPVTVLRGATTLAPQTERIEKTEDIVFVGNAKGENGRPIISDLLQTSHSAKIWGEGWNGIVPDEWVQDTYYPNDQLADLYARSRVVLNDHHRDMRLEGFVSNRIFDAVCSGASVVTDGIRPLPDDLAPFVYPYRDASNLQDVIDKALDGPCPSLGTMGELHARYSFDRVAERMLDQLPADGDSDKETALSIHPESQQQSEAYVVLGMHRSGTSLLTHLLHRGGLYAGSTLDHLTPAEDNPTGFWEFSPLVELNKIALYLANGSWANPPSAEALEKVSILPRASSVLKYFENVPKWVIKDPRLCLTFPLIEASLPSTVKIIFVKRSPEAIARSLKKRNGLPSAKAHALTEIYWDRARTHLPRYEHIEIQFEDLLSTERQDTLNRLEEFVGLEMDLPHHFKEVFRPDLNHH